MDVSTTVTLITSITTILVTLIGIIPTIVSNRKKTEERIDKMEANMEERIKEVDTKLDSHIDEDQEDQAVVCRSRILRFAKDVRNGDKLDYDGWNAIKIDCDKYEQYHNDHPSFLDGICDGTVKFLRDKLEELTMEGAFDGKIK